MDAVKGGPEKGRERLAFVTGKLAEFSLRKKLEDVLTFVPPVFEELASEMDEVGIERERVLQQLADEARERLESSIRRGARVAAREVDGASLVAAAETR